MTEKAFQDYYPEEYRHCYGCGSLNQDGLKIRSFWEGGETVAFYTPKPCHISLPGFVYGGLIASLIDCHCIASAAAGSYASEGRPMGSQPALRFVTASINVDYVRPTPLGVMLEIRGKIKEVGGKKVIVEARVLAGGEVCARGEVVAVRMPDSMRRQEEGVDAVL
jgi:acyl-coenzyme A thioesterase PaaI-like protein